MMIIRSTLSLLLLAFIVGCPQDGITQSFSTTEKQKFFQEYFHSNGQQWCLWKPSQAEQESFPVSDDGYCHTKLDTTLFYNSRGGAFAVLIFGTYDFQKGIPANCHGCAPFISVAIIKNTVDGSWKSVKFIKDFGIAGSWGGPPQYKIQQFGKQSFLKEEGGFTNLGSIELYKVFYHLPSLTEAIRIRSESYESDDKILTDWEETISDISTESKTMVLVTKKGFESKGKNKQVKYDLKKAYLFDETKSKFVQSN